MSFELTLSIVLYSASPVRPRELADLLQIASGYTKLRRATAYFRHLQMIAGASSGVASEMPGDNTLCGHWYKKRSPEAECMRLNFKRSESIDAVIERFRKSDPLIIDGVTCTGPVSRKTKSFFNAAWTFTYTDNSLYFYKPATTYHFCKDPTIVLNLSLGMIKKMKDKGMYALLYALAAWADARGDIYYGFADIWKSWESMAGDIFGGPVWISHSRLLAEQERRWWSHENDRMRTVRGVYLFNYFGPKMTEMLEREPSTLGRIAAMNADDIDWDPEDYDGCIVKKYANSSSTLALTDYYVELCGEHDTMAECNSYLYTHKMHWIYTQLARLGVIMK